MHHLEIMEQDGVFPEKNFEFYFLNSFGNSLDYSAHVIMARQCEDSVQ